MSSVAAAAQISPPELSCTTAANSLLPVKSLNAAQLSFNGLFCLADYSNRNKYSFYDELKENRRRPVATTQSLTCFLLKQLQPYFMTL